MQQVLHTVDLIVLHTLPDLNIRARKYAFDIRVIPNGNCFDKKLFTIVSVTQGMNGSVVINPSGTLTYKPSPGVLKSDTFTATVQDAEGDSSVRVIRVILPELREREIEMIQDYFHEIDGSSWHFGDHR